MWGSSITRGAGVGLLVLAAVTATANAVAAAQAPATIDLVEAYQRTLSLNPSLLASGYQLEAMTGRVTQANLRPLPEAVLLVEDAIGTGDFESFDAAEITLSLSWVLERGKRARRIDVARAEMSAVESEMAIRRLDASAETARRYIDTLAYQERLDEATNALTLAEETVTAVEARVKAGRSPIADSLRAEAERERARLALEEITHELLVSRHRLAARWGQPTPDFERVAGTTLTLPIAGRFAELLGRIERNPDVARFVTEERLREAELRLAEIQAKPDWRVVAGIRHHELTNDQAFVAGITVPLAIGNRNQGRIAEAEANLRRVGAEQAAVRLETETRLLMLHETLKHSLHVANALRDEILPRLERALLETRNAYAAGRFGYSELRVLQAEVQAARIDLVESRADAHRQSIELERLTGTATMPVLNQEISQ